MEKNITSAIERYIDTLGLSADLAKHDFSSDNFDKDVLIKKYSLINKQEITIISTFYNEANNVVPFYLECCRLRRIFNIKQMIFVQNGSSDSTQHTLNQLAESDPLVKIVIVEKNQGYGFGFKTGLRASSTDLVLLNHSDCQFDAYAFFTQHFPIVIKFDPVKEVILPVRRGRTIYARFRSTLLRWLAFALLRQAANEFNGQPKLFLKSRIGDIDTLPNDFGFDIGVSYRLLNQSEKVFFLDGIELPRFDGRSSWSVAFSGQLKLTRQYITSIARFRKNKSAS